MRYSISSALATAISMAGLALAETGQLGDALVVTDNPAGVVVKATFPEKPFFNTPGGNVKGSITASTLPGGKGVAFKLSISNLPKEGGPFSYHLHVDPVGEDGNCTKTLAHLDPFIRGEATPCDAADPKTCQVGDLSGKYGKITSDPFEATYVDDYVSLHEGVGSYFANRSIVVHFGNKTRITCANFEVIAGDTGAGDEDENCTSTMEPTSATSGVAHGTGVLTVPSATHSIVFVNAAAASLRPVGNALVAAAALAGAFALAL